jgi:hypothetical protein
MGSLLYGLIIMAHIHQIGTDYTVVETTLSDLTTHPCFTDVPGAFEIIDGELPKTYQKLIYQTASLTEQEALQELKDKVSALESDVGFLKA